MGNTEYFLELYKELEVLCQTEYGGKDDGSAITALFKQNEFHGVIDKIKYCREVRALLQHNPKLDKEYLVEPSTAMIKTLNNLIDRIKSAPKAMDYAIKKIESASMEDFVIPLMDKMVACNYTQIPILNNEKVVGAFSENTIFMYMYENKIMELNPATTFGQLDKYLPLEQHKTETFRFIKRNALLSDVEALFLQDFQKSQKLSMIFITQNGKKEEKLLGILTPWDIVGEGMSKI